MQLIKTKEEFEKYLRRLVEDNPDDMIIRESPEKYPCLVDYEYDEDSDDITLSFMCDIEKVREYLQKEIYKYIKGINNRYKKYCEEFGADYELLNGDRKFDFENYEKFEYFAIDKDGDGYVFMSKPILSSSKGWMGNYPTYVGRFNPDNYEYSLLKNHK